MKSFKTFFLESLNESLFGGGKKIEDHHYTLINTNVNKRVGHGTVWKTEAGAKNYQKGRGPDWQGDHMKVMTVGDAKKRGVSHHDFHNLAVSEEVELDESQKEYYTVHRAASLTSARMKAAVPGDQPTYHRSEEEALNHLNKKFKKVRDGVWKNNKDQFFFHKKNSPMKEEVEQIDEGVRLNPKHVRHLHEDTMPGNVALRLVDRHQAAAFHHKKNGNMKGYAAHFKVANAIEDSVIRAGRDMPIKSKRLEAASDKAFKEHPHRIVKNEEIELEEKLAWSHKTYDDYVAHNKQKGLQVLPKDLWHNLKKNPNQPSIKKEETDLDEAKKPKPGHNAAVLSKNISKIINALKNK